MFLTRWLSSLTSSCWVVAALCCSVMSRAIPRSLMGRLCSSRAARPLTSSQRSPAASGTRKSSSKLRPSRAALSSASARRRRSWRWTVRRNARASACRNPAGRPRGPPPGRPREWRRSPRRSPRRRSWRPRASVEPALAFCQRQLRLLDRGDVVVRDDGPSGAIESGVTVVTNQRRAAFEGQRYSMRNSARRPASTSLMPASTRAEILSSPAHDSWKASK